MQGYQVQMPFVCNVYLSFLLDRPSWPHIILIIGWLWYNIEQQLQGHYVMFLHCVGFLP